MTVSIDRRTMQLPRDQYVRQETRKSLVVLHHTAGASESSSVAWWRRTPERVATAFIIGRDGKIFECFPPEFWASHLGVGGSIESRSIGIEMANWGPLKKSGRTYLNWAGRTVDPEFVEDSGTMWRGYRYWEDYPEAQVDAAIALTRDLLDLFRIPSDVAPAQLGTPDVARFRRFTGVIAHHHVRTDKTDISPAFPWERLQAELGTSPGPADPLPLVTLQRGSKGPSVLRLQTKLQALGFYRSALDADYGGLTDLAVRRFQQSKGLAVDGVAGPRTLMALQ